MDKDLWAPLLEVVQFKPTDKKITFTANTKFIMTGCCMPEDPRKTGLKNGLRQLTTEQLKKVIDYPGEMVYDSFNYQSGNFCALAIGVGLDQTMIDPSHEKVFQALTDLGYSVYNTRGISGEFYTTNRKEDLLEAAQEVLQEKLNER